MYTASANSAVHHASLDTQAMTVQNTCAHDRKTEANMHWLIVLLKNYKHLINTDISKQKHADILTDEQYISNNSKQR